MYRHSDVPRGRACPYSILHSDRDSSKSYLLRIPPNFKAFLKRTGTSRRLVLSIWAARRWRGNTVTVDISSGSTSLRCRGPSIRTSLSDLAMLVLTSLPLPFKSNGWRNLYAGQPSFVWSTKKMSILYTRVALLRRCLKPGISPISLYLSQTQSFIKFCYYTRVKIHICNIVSILQS